jgi:hypothetical protein
MPMPMWKSAALLLGFAVSPASAQTACPLTHWRDHHGVALLHDAAGSHYFFHTDHKGVDADGAPNAYHPDDAGKPCKKPGKGLDCPANAGFPGGGWPNVLVRDPAKPSRPFVQTAGPHAGFFVSMTSLRNTGFAGPTNPASYVDATRTPYLVMAGDLHALAGTGSKGDVGFALNLANGKSTPFVIADVGPNEPFGEGSIALWEALGGTSPNPRTGNGVPDGDIAFVIFPGSRNTGTIGWPIDQTRLAAKTVPLLGAAGGEAMLRACAAP